MIIKRLQHGSVRVGLEMSLTLLRLCTSKTWNPRQPAQGRQPPMPPSGINKAVRAGSGFIYVTLVTSYLNIKYITKSEHHHLLAETSRIEQVVIETWCEMSLQHPTSLQKYSSQIAVENNPYLQFPNPSALSISYFWICLIIQTK